MSKRKQNEGEKPLARNPHESAGPMPLDEIARHIAILIVHQHRRLKAGASKKADENVL